MAGFNTAVTGLKAATTDLDVTGNNIANASTIGFKSSRTEFGDIYATAVVGAGSSNVAGSGVTVTDIAQDFQAGTIEFTNNNLDLAINGSGFFQLDDGQGGTTYTRAGSFELDKNGFIVSKTGKYLQGYGLDSEGNRLPIGDLSVQQKESPPKATEDIDLSFNIDSRADASTLLQPYDKDEPSSFTYSTTMRTFDSLGNEHTIKFNMVEQPPVREVQTLDFSATPDGGLTGATSGDANVVVSGVTLDKDIMRSGSGLNPDGTFVSGDYRLPGQVNTLEMSALTNPASIASVDLTIGTHTINNLAITLGAADDEQDLASAIAGLSSTIVQDYNNNKSASEPYLINVIVDPMNPEDVYFQFDDSDSAPATLSINLDDGSGGVSAPTITQATTVYDFGAEVTSLLNGDPRIKSIEVAADGQSFDIRFNASAADVDDVQVRDTTGNLISDVAITSENLSASEVHTYSFNSAAFTSGTLTAAAPTITIGGVSITLNTADTQDDIESKIVANQAAIIDANPNVESVGFNASGQLVITYRPEAGNVDNDILDVNFNDGTNDIMQITNVIAGDDSYDGVYRMYAYLNGTEALDLGKAVDPGEPGYVAPTASGTSSTEPGPILVTFNATNGLLASVNGQSVPLGGTAPSVTISGADPADPTTTIALDITNTTQFASASIVKASAQDGYTKGDLIGVTFSGTGEMVASFSNGQNQDLGVVAIATFENQSGLQPSGDTEWTATLTSGDPIVNPPGTGLNGTLQSAALEQSNVDLSAELVSLIEAQRNFQANSKTLETLNTVTQNILQI